MKKEIKGENVTNKNLVTIKIKQRKEPITGLYVNHDNNWVAVLENTYDYVLDGYTFINREWIDHFHIETDRIADYIFSNSKWKLINSTLLFPPALFDKDKEKLVEIWQHKAHKFRLADALTLTQLQALRDTDGLEEALLPTDRIFADFNAVHVEEKWRKLIDNGNAFYPGQTMEQTTYPAGEWVRVYREDDSFVGIYAYDGVKEWYKPVKIFPSNTESRK
jgi:hypothetical protein